MSTVAGKARTPPRLLDVDVKSRLPKERMRRDGSLAQSDHPVLGQVTYTAIQRKGVAHQISVQLRITLRFCMR